MSATCKQCNQEYYGPSVPHINYSQYCQICKQCSNCHRQIDPAALDFCLKYTIEHPWLCTDCQSQEYREKWELRQIAITAKELDWLNRVRLMIDVQMDMSVDTNMRSAELAAESWIVDMPQESAYMFLKRMEAITASVSVALKRVKGEIKLKLEQKERFKYQAAETTSKRTQLEQCVHCKKRFTLDTLEQHKKKCTGDLSAPERAQLKRFELAVEGFTKLGIDRVEAEKMVQEQFDRLNNKERKQ